MSKVPPPSPKGGKGDTAQPRVPQNSPRCRKAQRVEIIGEEPPTKVGRVVTPRIGTTTPLVTRTTGVVGTGVGKGSSRPNGMTMNRIGIGNTLTLPSGRRVGDRGGTQARAISTSSKIGTTQKMPPESKAGYRWR